MVRDNPTSDGSGAGTALRLTVEDASPNADGVVSFTGKITSGTLTAGDEVIALPSATRARVASLALGGTQRASASASDQVVVTLEDGGQIPAGQIVCHTSARAEIADQLSASVIWTGSQRLFKGRPYVLRCAGQEVVAQITDVKYRFDGATATRTPAHFLESGETGVCTLSLDVPIAFDPHKENPVTGSFTLSDRATAEDVASGNIAFALRRAHNIHWQALSITREQRAEQKGQRACCLWFTGLSGAGKSTIANLLEKRLFALGLHSYILDGDNVRHGLNKDLGFTEADRVENIRRVAEVARLMYDAGLLTIVSFISPFRAERQFARERFPQGDFLEIFVDTPIEVCEKRDPKGLYKKARTGQLANFTGINSPYEPPENPDFHVGRGETAEESVELILSELGRRMFLDPM